MSKEIPSHVWKDLLTFVHDTMWRTSFGATLRWRFYTQMSRGNHGTRNVPEPPGAGKFENVLFLSRETRELSTIYTL